MALSHHLLLLLLLGLLLLPSHARDVIWECVQVVAASGAATEQQLSNGQTGGSSHIISLGQR
jgi:hypothetical protein